MGDYTIPTPANQRIPQAENLFKFLLLASLIQANFVLVSWLVHSQDWPLPAVLALILLAAGLNSLFIIGLGALAHDAVHRVLFRNRFMNETVGGLADALMLTPFHANRQFHLTHHGNAHQPGRDPENSMHQRSFWGAMTVGALMGLYLQYRIWLVNLATRLFDRRYTQRVLMDPVFLGVAAVFYLVLPGLLGADLLLTVVPTWLVFPLVFSVRALSDHYGVPAVAPGASAGDFLSFSMTPAVQSPSKQTVEIADGMDWYNPGDRIKVTGWVVLTHPLLRWLWSSVNYHEVHHKYPHLAHAHLKDVFAHTASREPYLVVNGYVRSLLNQRRRSYYEDPVQVKDFLTRTPPGQNPVEPHA